MLAFALLTLAACGERLPTYRYKITVEVETPEGLRTGSAVREVRSYDLGKGFPGPEAGGGRSKLIGEAVAVDLPNGDALFALLRGEDESQGHPEVIASQALRPFVEARLGRSLETASVGKQDVEGRLEVLRTSSLKATVKPNNYPLLVRFRDMDDPSSVEKVEPDNLSESFGQGYALRRITVETTDERVTTGIRSRLEWMDEQKAAFIKRPKGMSMWDLPIGGRLTTRDFERGGR